jgi:GNAT superfamily N-acetyltransferase
MEFPSLFITWNKMTKSIYATTDALSLRLFRYLDGVNQPEAERLYKLAFGKDSTEKLFTATANHVRGYINSCELGDLVTIARAVYGDNDEDINFLKCQIFYCDPNEIKIRKARPDDIPEVCRIIGQLSPGQPHNYKDAIEKYKSHIRPSPDYFLWVAILGTANPKIVGTAIMHLHHKLSYHCGTAAHLEDVVVDEPYRGKGIGEKLVAKAVETATEHNCYKLMLTCFAKTVPYYEKFGFTSHDIGMRLELKPDLYPKKTS